MEDDNRESVELKIEKSFQGHEDAVLSVIFFQEIGRIVSCSYDHSIRIWNIETSECIKLLNHHGDIVRDLLKWNDHIFFSCARDGKIFEYSIDSLEKLSKIWEPTRGSEGFFASYNSTFLQKMLKINRDIFILTEWGKHSPMLISYSKKMCVKTLSVQEIRINSGIALSRRYENSFYLSSESGSYSIKLIDYEKNEISRGFLSSDLDYTHSKFSTFIDQRKQEILVVSSTDGKILLYDTKENGRCIKILEFKGRVSSQFILEDRYLFTSNFYLDGRYQYTSNPIKKGFTAFRIIDLRENSNYNMIHHGNMEKFHNDSISFMRSLDSSSTSKRRIITASEDNSFKILEVSGIPFFDEDSKDMSERIEYFWGDCLNQMILKEEENLIIRLSLINLSVNIFKFLLL